MTGRTSVDGRVSYIGNVEVLQRQSEQEAADYRLRMHLSHRKWCLKNVTASTMVCKAVGRKLLPAEALLQETVLTVVEMYAKDPKLDGRGVMVRGGPYCLVGLTSSMRLELQQLKAILGLRSFAEQRDKVKSIAKGMPVTSHLRKHLEDRCYVCNSVGWRTCACRGSKRGNVVPPSSSSCSSSSRTRAETKSPVLPFARKRQSGKRPVMKRAKRVPMKRKRTSFQRSSNYETGSKRLKKKIRSGDMGLNDNEYQRFKYGQTPVLNRKQQNAKYYQKRKELLKTTKVACS